MTQERVDTENPGKPGKRRGLLVAWLVAVVLLAAGGAIFAYLIKTPQRPGGQVHLSWWNGKRTGRDRD